MKSKLRSRFPPLTYIQDSYSQLHNLTQGNLNVEEYTHEFEKLKIQCDIQEPKEQTIVRYLEGLELKYANVVELQQFATFDEVCVLAYKVEQQRKANPFKHDFSKPTPLNQPFNEGSFNPSPKPMVPPPSTP